MAVTNEQIQQWFQANPNATETDVYNAMQAAKVDVSQLSNAMNFNQDEVQKKYLAQQALAQPSMVPTVSPGLANPMPNTPATFSPSIYDSDRSDRQSFVDVTPAAMGIASLASQATTPPPTTPPPPATSPVVSQIGTGAKFTIDGRPIDHSFVGLSEYQNAMGVPKTDYKGLVYDAAGGSRITTPSGERYYSPYAAQPTKEELNWLMSEPNLTNVTNPTERAQKLESWQKSRPGYVDPMNYNTFEEYIGAANPRYRVGKDAGNDLTGAANFYGLTIENYLNTLSGDMTRPMGANQSVYGAQLLSPLQRLAAETARGQGISTMSPQTAALAKANPDVFNAASQKYQNYFAKTYPGTLEYESVLAGPMQFSSTGVKMPVTSPANSMFLLSPDRTQIIKNTGYRPTQTTSYGPTQNTGILSTQNTGAVGNNPVFPLFDYGSQVARNVNQPINEFTGYSNVFNPETTPVNYSTTPVTVKPGTYTPPTFPPVTTVPGFAEGGEAQAGEAQAPVANPFEDPNTMAVYDQMRQTVSPKEFGDEMLAGAAQIDPEAMAQFRNDLSQVDLSPEDLNMLNNMVDEILANPEQYAAVRAKYLEMGAPEELLPEQFDPQFFAAMNMAVDQLIAEPAGVQSFAQGGIAELKPIAKAIASYGRNGDTMLAHITPAEARMLRRRGGSGTINPATGLPEFFLKKAFKSLGKAVKSFASSTVGKIITTVALGFFLGPAAASFMGVTSAAGVAAVGGFIGSAGSTLLAGGNLKDALKAGAIGGLTAGAVGGVTQGFDTAYAGPTTVGGQVDKFTNAVTPSASASGIQAPAIDAAGQTRGLAPTDVTQAPYKPLEMTGTPSKPFDSYFGSQPATDVLRDNFTTNTAREAYGTELARTNPEALYNPNAATPDALTDFTAKKSSLVLNPQTGNLEPPPGFTVGQTTLPGGQILTQNVPIEAPYDPATATRAVDFGYKPGGTGSTAYQTPTIGESFSKMGEGLGMGDGPASFDTFKQGAGDLFAPGPNNAQITTRAQEIMRTTPGATLKDAMAAASKELSPNFFRTYGPATLAGIGAIGAAGGFKAAPAQPSALRDQLMKPVSQRIAEGGNQRNYYIQGLPGVKYDQYGAPIFGQYEPMPVYDTGLGIASLAGPRGYAAGGEVTANNFDEVAYKIAYPDVAAAIAKGDFENAYQHYERYGKAEGRTAFNKAETAAVAAKTDTETKAKQATARETVATTKAAKKAKGSTSAYQNINAGLAYDAPEGYAANAIAARQAAFAPTLNKFINAGIANTAVLSKPYSPTVVDQPYNKFPGYVPPTTSIAPPVVTAPITDLRPTTPLPTPVTPAKPVDPTVLDAETERARLGQRRYSDQEIVDYLKTNPGQTDRQIAEAMFKFNVRPDQVMRATGTENLAGTNQSIDLRYDTARAPIVTAPPVVSAAEQARLAQQYSDQDVKDWFLANQGQTDRQVADAMFKFNVRPDQVIRATGTQNLAGTDQSIDLRYDRERAAALKETPVKVLNMGGIATLGSGGYPRRTGQINGPGTATSDSIPAMLSDGEFVMTAKAVRGAGKGDRRAGAKRMYALMNQLEKNAARG